MSVALSGVCFAETIIEEAITKPSEDRTVSFIRSGLVAKVFVKDDDLVKAGQTLAKLDDAAERIQLLQLEETAKDITQLEAEKAQWEHAKIELQLKEEAHKNGVAPKLEVMQAEMQVRIADARVKIAEFNNKINKLRFKEASIQVERMALRSPIDGIVEEVAIDEGEAVDTQMRPVIRIIRIDPMWVDVNVPTRPARKYLRKGQSARVQFEGIDKPKTGTIIKISSDADSASDTVRVRVEVPNPEKRGTGETVTVTFGPSFPSFPKGPDSNKPTAGNTSAAPTDNKENQKNNKMKENADG
jgi:RND family efflux transporter MFP subunit